MVTNFKQTWKPPPQDHTRKSNIITRSSSCYDRQTTRTTQGACPPYNYTSIFMLRQTDYPHHTRSVSTLPPFHTQVLAPLISTLPLQRHVHLHDMTKISTHVHLHVTTDYLHHTRSVSTLQLQHHLHLHDMTKISTHVHLHVTTDYLHHTRSVSTLQLQHHVHLHDMTKISTHVHLHVTTDYLHHTRSVSTLQLQHHVHLHDMTKISTHVHLHVTTDRLTTPHKEPVHPTTTAPRSSSCYDRQTTRTTQGACPPRLLSPPKCWHH